MYREVTFQNSTFTIFTVFEETRLLCAKNLVLFYFENIMRFTGQEYVYIVFIGVFPTSVISK